MDTVALLRRGEEPTDPLGFVKALMAVSELDGSEAMTAMYELFDSRNALREPLRVPLKPGADAAAFVQRCADHGISATVQDAWP
jgi:hypothetical protein